MDSLDDLTPSALRRRLQELEVANRELLEANRRLGRSWLGRSDGAAASVLAGFASAVQELRERDEWQRRRLKELEAEVLRVGDEREEYRRALERATQKKIVRLALRLDRLRRFLPR
jgi:hypothetical protein